MYRKEPNRAPKLPMETTRFKLGSVIKNENLKIVSTLWGQHTGSTLTFCPEDHGSNPSGE